MYRKETKTVILACVARCTKDVCLVAHGVTRMFFYRVRAAEIIKGENFAQPLPSSLYHIATTFFNLAMTALLFT